MDERQYECAAWLESRERETGIERARRGEAERPRERDGVRYCLDCDEPIDPRRLQACPAAVRCIECQTIHDQRKRMTRQP